ncbi:ankyrin repeat and LEM domain-containing protein 2 homolog [Halyomorpha halys]|uniref:ankyrin repeat and LEM domain-containing protein 2 homolog n=1 Tax=Halyomorpha halys TaxID=286706 RepID=UPI0006D5267F|nr:uncharacterized protein LOC106689640 [Halyomorpha halys]
MDSSVILEDCYDFSNPCKYDEDCDDLLDLDDEISDEGTGRDRIFITESGLTSLVDLREIEKDEKGQKYYSIYDELWYGQIIYNDKAKALQTLKEYENARLKCFQSLEGAIEFAKCGGRFYCKFNFPLTDKIFWKMPRSRDLVHFRKAIQSGNLKTVMDLIDENPRYLVGNGDTPTILQGGCRYNALHVAAMARSATVCSYILSVASDIAFAERLYGKTQSNEQRVDILLDFYLNMPDKGHHETPLHFASKLGALDVLKVLISYSQCDKNVKNKDGMTPLEVACARFPNHLAIKNEIAEALGRQFFVPLLRSKDNAIQPVVGAPCTSENPPVWYSDRLTSALEVKAVAGPMSEELAHRFRKKWKTPPRNLQGFPKDRPHLSDPEKGFEKLGRKLAGEFQVGWKEYWSFLDSFVDLSSKEGLLELDGHLKKKYEALGEINSLQPVSRISFLSISQLFRFKNCFGRKIATSKDESSGFNNCSIITDSNPRTPVNISEHRPEYSDRCNPLSPEYKRVIFSPMDTNKYYEIFAKRITNSLVAMIKSKTLFEISYFQKFLTGCSKDNRFCDIDLTQSHYRLSVFITKRVLDEPESLLSVRHSLDLILSLETKDLDEDPGILVFEDLLKVTACILQNVKEMLSNKRDISEMEGGESTLGKPCDCKLPLIKDKSESYSSLCRRLSFSDAEDSSESDESFHTARSNLEDAENYDDPSPTTPPGVFIAGHSPTKVDKAVLEAIESVSLCLSDYPHISRWKMSFQSIYEKREQYNNDQ